MPVTLVCSGCGNSYQLKDELAGRKVPMSRMSKRCRSSRLNRWTSSDRGRRSGDESTRILISTLPSTRIGSCSVRS